MADDVWGGIGRPSGWITPPNLKTVLLAGASVCTSFAGALLVAVLCCAGAVVLGAAGGVVSGAGAGTMGAGAVPVAVGSCAGAAMCAATGGCAAGGVVTGALV